MDRKPRNPAHPARLFRHASWKDVPLNHGSGGECLVTSLFHLLWLKTHTFIQYRRDEDEEPIRIPDTILYEPVGVDEDAAADQELQPSSWYFTSVEDGRIRRKGFKKHSQITEALRKRDIHFRKSDVVAQWIGQDVNNQQEPAHRSPDFDLKSIENTDLRAEQWCPVDLSEKCLELGELADVVEGKSRPCGQRAILQAFVHPQGEHNEVFRVSWSASDDLEVERCFNSLSLYSYENTAMRTATFPLAGMHKYPSTVEVDVKGEVFPTRLKMLCENVVRHVALVSEGNLKIHKMRLYFKLGEQNKLYLLFCDTLQYDHELSSIEKMRLDVVPRVDLTGSTQGKNEPPRNLGGDFMCPKCRLSIMIPEVYATPIGNVIADFERMCELQHNHPEIILNPDAAIGATLQPKPKVNARTRLLERLLHEEQMRQRKASLSNGEKTKPHIQIPPALQLIYPNLTLNEYKIRKKNPKFLMTGIELCQGCFMTVRNSGDSRSRRQAKPREREHKKDSRESKKKRAPKVDLTRIVAEPNPEENDDGFGDTAVMGGYQETQEGVDDTEYIYAQELGLTKSASSSVAVESRMSRQESSDDMSEEDDSDAESDEEYFTNYAGRITNLRDSEDMADKEQLAADIYTKLSNTLHARGNREHVGFPKIPKRSLGKSQTQGLLAMPNERVLKTRPVRSRRIRHWDMTYINPGSSLNLGRAKSQLSPSSRARKRHDFDFNEMKGTNFNPETFKWISRDVHNHSQSISTMLSRSSSAPHLRPSNSRRSLGKPLPLKKSMRKKATLPRPYRQEPSPAQHYRNLVERPGSVRDIRARELMH